MAFKEEIKEKPNLSVLALVSFIASFATARTFTTFFPTTSLIIGGLHIHHFWYGLAMLAVGGWLGISYESERINRLAAVLFGLGGGLIGDEVGLLLTFGNYWSELTYNVVIAFLAVMSIIILVSRYSSIMRKEFTEFLQSNASLYVGIFLAAVSLAFVLETDNEVIVYIFSSLTIVGFIIVLSYFVQRIRAKQLKIS
ncbi:MAG: hypothetical protein QHH24_04405 [Candidatus Bathyarchaeota archaeon]|nr:hypothetical protein [Candidatus Bathyarchaeota archaeon]